MPHEKLNTLLNLLLPIIVLIVGKFLGVYLVSSFFSVELSQFSFSYIFDLGESFEHEINSLVTSYADLVMFSVVSVGLLGSLYRHSMNKPNKEIQKVLKSKAVSYDKAYTLYGSSVFWYGALVLTNVIILINTYNDITELWVFMMTLTLTSSLGYYFYIDYVNEATLANTKN